MKISELKQRQKLRNIKTGEICQVSKKWDGVYLIDPKTKKTMYRPDPFNQNVEISDWECVA